MDEWGFIDERVQGWRGGCVCITASTSPTGWISFAAPCWAEKATTAAARRTPEEVQALDADLAEEMGWPREADNLGARSYITPAKHQVVTRDNNKHFNFKRSENTDTLKAYSSERFYLLFFLLYQRASQ